MTTNDPHQHLRDYKALLDSLDGRVVTVNLIPATDRDLDRLAEDLDRHNRRKVLRRGR